MAQAGAAAASGACDVQLLEAVTVPEAVAGPLRELALGLDGEHRFCVRMGDLVQIACGNNRSGAEAFLKSHEQQGLLEAAGQAVWRKCKWNRTKAVWTCDLSCAERVMRLAADQKEGNVAHTGSGAVASGTQIEDLVGAMQTTSSCGPAKCHRSRT